MLLDTNEIEEEAAAAVAAELGAERATRIDTGRDGFSVRDFDLVFPDGHCEPLEVTSDADTIALQSRARLAGNEWIAANVKRGWMVPVDQATKDERGRERALDVRAVARFLKPFVERLDAMGITHFNTADLAWPFGPHAVSGFEEEADMLLSLGVHHGGAYGPVAEEWRGISLHIGSAGYYGIGTVPRVVERIAALPDNVAKLTASQASRRHLFVALIGVSEELAFAALDDIVIGRHFDLDEIPLPELPDAVTTVWAGFKGVGAYVTPPDRWKLFGCEADEDR